MGTLFKNFLLSFPVLLKTPENVGSAIPGMGVVKEGEEEEEKEEEEEEEEEEEDDKEEEEDEEEEEEKEMKVSNNSHPVVLMFLGSPSLHQVMCISSLLVT